MLFFIEKHNTTHHIQPGTPFHLIGVSSGYLTRVDTMRIKPISWLKKKKRGSETIRSRNPILHIHIR